MASSIKLTNANGKVLTLSHQDTHNEDNIVDVLSTAYTIETINGFATVPTGFKTVIVKDSNRGGTFVWSATGTANSGTVFAGATGFWTRQYSGAVNVKWFGAKGDGVTNDTISISSTLTYMINGGTLYFPMGTYLSDTYHAPSYLKTIGDGKIATTIKRSLAGDFSVLGSYSGFVDLTIDGNYVSIGGGKGCKILPSTFNQYMINSEIKNFSEPCLEFSANGGSEFKSIASDFYTAGTVGVVGAVTVNGIDTQAVPRHFYETGSGGCTLFSFGGCNDFFASGFYSNGLIFSSNSSKVQLNNMRIGASAGVFNIAGGGHAISGVSAVAYTTSSIDSVINMVAPSWDITDNGSGNSILIKEKSYIPVITASGGGFSLGNGSILGRWSRDGNKITVEVDFSVGSTTAVGTGQWNFSMPIIDKATSPVQMCGSGFAISSTGANSCVFAVRLTPAAQSASLFYATTTGAGDNVGATKPAATWGAGATVRFSCVYYTV